MEQKYYKKNLFLGRFNVIYIQQTLLFSFVSSTVIIFGTVCYPVEDKTNNFVDTTCHPCSLRKKFI